MPGNVNYTLTNKAWRRNMNAKTMLQDQSGNRGGDICQHKRLRPDPGRCSVLDM